MQKSYCISAIGQDSHRFDEQSTEKGAVIAGVCFDELPVFAANSDGDPVYHAIMNALTGLNGKLYLGSETIDQMVKDGCHDSSELLHYAYHDFSGRSNAAASASVSASATATVSEDFSGKSANASSLDSLGFAPASPKQTKGRYEILNISISIEALRPRFKDKRAQMSKNIADILEIEPEKVKITATTGEGLTAFGCGEGVFATVIISAAYRE